MRDKEEKIPIRRHFADGNFDYRRKSLAPYDKRYGVIGFGYVPYLPARYDTPIHRAYMADLGAFENHE